jgi:hypothetical protein
MVTRSLCRYVSWRRIIIVDILLIKPYVCLQSYSNVGFMFPHFHRNKNIFTNPSVLHVSSTPIQAYNVCLMVLTPFSTIFQLYPGNKFYWWMKPEDPEKTCLKLLTKLYHIILYTSPWSRFELTTSVVIGTDCTCSCQSNYHTITTTTSPITCVNNDNLIREMSNVLYFLNELQISTYFEEQQYLLFYI